MKTLRNSLMYIMLLISTLVMLSSQSTFAVEASVDTYGEILKDYNVIIGYKGDLMVDRNISRVEMMAIISRLFPKAFNEYVPPIDATFDDVKTTHWGYKYVEFAYEKGITTGKSTSIFGVSDSVNYNQVSIFLMKALGYKLNDVTYATAASEISNTYGLKLLLPKQNSETLKRGEVFELVVKALLLEDATGKRGIETLTSDTQLQDAFATRSEAHINTPVAVYAQEGIYNIYYANGDLYTGEFDGKYTHGNGMLNFADGNLYIGQFEKGRFQGYGIFIWQVGEFYEGEWANDSYNGLGTYTYPDGSYQYGEWVDDTLVKSLDEVTPDQIKAGTAISFDTFNIELLGTDRLPLKGIAMTVTDQTNDVSYNLISDVNGLMSIPKNGDFSIVSLTLGENSAFNFSISRSANMVTTVGTYKSGVTFELYK